MAAHDTLPDATSVVTPNTEDCVALALAVAYPDSPHDPELLTVRELMSGPIAPFEKTVPPSESRLADEVKLIDRDSLVQIG